MWSVSLAVVMTALSLGVAAPAPEDAPAGAIALADADPVETLNRLLLEAQPEGENAWPVYEAALREFLHPEFDTEEGVEELGAIRIIHAGRVWDDEDRQEARALVAKHRELLAAFEAASMWPGFTRRYDPPVPEIMLKNAHPERVAALQTLALHDDVIPMLRALRIVGVVNVVALRLALEDNDWDEAATRLRLGMRLGTHLSLQRLQIEWLVGAAIITGHARTLCHTLTEVRIPEAAAARLLVALGGDPWIRSRYGEIAEIERMLMTPMVHMIAGHTPERVRHLRLELSLRSLATGWRDISTMHPFERASFGQQARSEGDRLDFNDPLKQVRMSLAAGADAFNAMDLLLTELAATRAMLLLEAHFARTGRWPERLQDALGDDGAIDPVTGGAFQYRLLDDGAGARAYELRLPEEAPEGWLSTTGRVLNPARE